MTGVASAENLGGQRFDPASSEGGVLGTEDSFERKHMKPYVSLWLNYALDPVVVLDPDGEEIGPLVEHLLAADLVASMNVWKGLEFGLLLPLTLVQTGDDAAAAQAGVPAPGGGAMGDLQLRAGYRHNLNYNTSIAFFLPVLLPTANADNTLALGVGVRPTVAATFGLGAVDLLTNLSYLIRKRQALADYDGGDELGLRVGLRAGLDDRWDTALLGEIGLATELRDFFSAPGTPMEIRGGVEHWFTKHWRLTGFVGTGLTTGTGAPDVRIGAGLAYGEQPRHPRIKPLPGDRDADGIMDVDDACPDEPEDKDGFEDEDGCPDFDNDQDGFLDTDDACPNEPETFDGIADDDGCPDHIRVEGTQITTFEAVQYKTGSDEILEPSFPMLMEVARVMEANPDMAISVEGHTDSQGDEEANRNLSQRRAESVRTFLIEHGVDEGRVDAVGHGEANPISDNDTHKGRKKNRRVEFHIKQ